MKEEKLKTYKAISNDLLMTYRKAFIDLGDLMEKHQNPTDDDDFWESLLKECRQVGEKYGNSKFVTQEIVNLLLEIERIWEDAAGREKRNCKFKIVKEEM